MSRVDRRTESVKKLESIVSTCCVSNWNGYGADPIPQNVISIVKKMLPFLSKDVEIFPTADQSIQLEVDIAGEGYFECVIQKDGSIEFFIAPASVSLLSDEQREQLKALYTLGYKWLAKDFDYQVYAHAGSKPSKSDEEWRNDCDCFIRIHDGLPESAIKSLVSWSDPEPYDIVKALGVEG